MATVARQTVVDHRESQCSMVALYDEICFATMMNGPDEDEVSPLVLALQAHKNKVDRLRDLSKSYFGKGRRL